ncbi:hypothetical protein ACFFRR_010295 [Megaselia abdita]
MAQKRIIYQRKMKTIVGLLTLAVLSGADVSHLNLHDPHTYQPRTSYDDVVDPIYPPLSDYHQAHARTYHGHGYDIGLPANEEYAADFPQSFDHHISGHEVNSDLNAHTLDFQDQFETLTADYKPIHEPQSEESYDMPKFENTVFHQVPAPKLGKYHNYGFDTSVQDFSDLAPSHHLESHGRSIESAHRGLFTPSTHYDSVYNRGQHLQYTNSLLKK